MDGDDGRWRPKSVLFLLLVSFGTFYFMLNVFQINSYRERRVSVMQQQFPVLTEEDNLKGFLIKTSACRIPEMDAFDKSILKFVSKEKGMVCNKGLPQLIASNLTSLYVVYSSLEAYGLKDEQEFSCCYKPFWRVEPGPKETDHKISYGKECFNFNGSVNISEEFIRVTCRANETEFYKDFFSFVPPKNTTETSTPKNLNVLIIGIDSISRLNLLRQMPRTIEYVQQNLSAFEFLGYNKVADNTFPNLVPVLTGVTVEELANTCWINNSHFDDCNFIWNDYKKHGYATVFAEDSAWMGLFNYQKRGFHKQPTDYYWGVFNYIQEDETGNEHHVNVYNCVTSKKVYKTLIDYTDAFVRSMQLQNKHYFGLFWGASLSHDSLNYPSLGDEDYYELLRNLHIDGLLNETAVIFMSDHGMRFGNIRGTYQGMMEERLPFLYISLPDWYKLQHPEVTGNLYSNSRRLSTHFDLHETLRDLLEPQRIQNRANQQNRITTRGFSLFERIPETRTCSDANISSHWCTCQESVEVDPQKPEIIEAALYTIDYMNDLLIDYDCANLTLGNITEARQHVHSEHLTKKYPAQDYTLVLNTNPGGGLFEVTVRKIMRNKNDYDYNIVGTISRINLYGNQSHCVADFHLKLYCYCKDFLKETTSFRF